ncbi:MAG TPA: PLDc N-terminal domain-containing protein [Chitinophagaceae bacterium]|jgi:predicted membrane channel-forming protein YqfA (hemolysin III family)|nr:PLDc N-terminal domain-containing protein [Chitinophagaceae bacterium]
MKNLKHPNFILGIFSILLVIIGVGVKAYGYHAGDWMVIAAVVLGGIHWIWGVIDVIARHDMKPFQKRFWLIAVIAAPAIGGLLFYIMHQRPNKLTT